MENRPPRRPVDLTYDHSPSDLTGFFPRVVIVSRSRRPKQRPAAKNRASEHLFFINPIPPAQVLSAQPGDYKPKSLRKLA